MISKAVRTRDRWQPCSQAARGWRRRRRRKPPIGVSYQPSLYWALPFHYATVKGWWKEVGLTPTFSTFPAGAPQIAASAAKSWDVGGTGSVPAVLGAVRFNILTIGITNDESKANAMLVRGDKFDAIKADPKLLKGQRLLLTTNSTVDYAARKCLTKFGLAQNDMQFVNLGQAQIITAVTSNNGDIAGVWAPNTYTLEDRANAKYLCSGADAGAVVPGALVVRADFAKEHPDDVAKFLAVYPARLVLGQGQSDGGAHAGARFLQAGRARGDRARDGPGVRAAADLPARRAVEDHVARRRRLDGRRLVLRDRQIPDRGRHDPGESRCRRTTSPMNT